MNNTTNVFFRDRIDLAPASGFMLLGIVLVVTYVQKVINYFDIYVHEKQVFFGLGILVGLAMAVLNMGIRFVATFCPQVLFMTLMPLRIFYSTFTADMHVLTRNKLQLLMMSTLGMLLFILFYGFTMSCLVYGHADWHYIFVYGMAMSTFDWPIINRMLVSYESLNLANALLTAETIVTNAQAIILFLIYVGYLNEIVVSWYHFIGLYMRMMFGAILVGCVMGRLSALIMNKLIGSVHTMVLGWLIVMYGVYALCEYVLFCSGIIGVFVVAMFVSLEKSRISLKSDRRLRLFMESCDMVFTASIYVQVLAFCVLESYRHFELRALYLSMCSFFATTLTRVVVLLILYPLIFRDRRFNNCILISMALSNKGIFELMKLIMLMTSAHCRNVIAGTFIYAIFTVVAQQFFTNIFIRRVLRTFCSNVVDYAHITNIANCLQLLEITRNSYLSLYKMERFYGDANWAAIIDTTRLRNEEIYKQVQDWQKSKKSMIGLALSAPRPSCRECSFTRTVATEQESKEQVSEIKRMILQTQKTSFIRQKERGLMLKSNLKYLLYAVEVATKSEDKRIDIDKLLAGINERTYIDRLKIFFAQFIQDRYNLELQPPRVLWRRRLYRLMHNRYHYTIMYILALTTRFFIYSFINRLYNNNLTIILVIYAILMLDLIGKILIYWHIEFREGCRHFLRSMWNCFDLVMFAWDTIELSVLLALQMQPDCTMNIFGHMLLMTLTQVGNLRVLKIIQIFYEARYYLVRMCNIRIGRRLLVAYGLALSVLFSYHEVLHVLPTITDDLELRESLELDIVRDKAKVLFALCMVQYQVPWVPATAKTRRVINASINTMRDSVTALKLMGITDDYEYTELVTRIEALRDPLFKLMYVQPYNPPEMFKSLPFFEKIRQQEELYEKAAFRLYEKDELILSEGKASGGVHIVIEGLALTAHKLDGETIVVAGMGGHPIEDYINDIDFHCVFRHYIIPGNCIGILSFLTGRVCNCNVRALVATRTIFLSEQALMEAMEANSDPVYGLRSKMWKYVSMSTAMNILWDVPIYRYLRIEELYYYMEKSFMPITTGRGGIRVPESVEDMILIEGRVRDKATKTVYTAPCYIPRSVRQIEFLRKRILEIEPQLFIIPLNPEMQNEIFQQLNWDAETPSKNYHRLVSTLVQQNKEEEDE